jgi:tetratricopeptide (TPR) repeat protein
LFFRHFNTSSGYQLLAGCFFLTLAGCDRPAQQDDLALLDIQVIALNNRGVGLMGRYDYDAALQVFRQLATQYPQQLTFQVNHAIALMNRQVDGDEADALRRFDALAAEYPADPRVRYCTGLLEFRRGELARATEHLQAVSVADPHDPYAAYFLAQSYQQRGDHTAALDWYRRALDADPYLRSAYYALAQVFRQQGQSDDARHYLELYQQLASNPRAQLVEFKYTRMGPKCEAATAAAAVAPVEQRPAGPLFAEPGILLPPASEAQAGRSNLTVADIDADGRLDLFLAGRGGQDGGHNAVLLGQDDGSFAVAGDHPLAAVPGVNMALWGDFDNDGHTDVYLGRRGPNQLWQHTADGHWQDVTAATQTGNGTFDTVDGALFDADHDGDLDLFLVNSDGPDELLNNNLDGSFRPLAAEHGLDGGTGATRQVLLLDIDNDRDTDIITLKAAPPHAMYINELGWNYTPASGQQAFLNTPMAAVISADNDADGHPELYALGADGSVMRWRVDTGGPWAKTVIGKLPAAEFPQLELRDVDGDGHGELLLAGGEGLGVYSLQGDTLAPLYRFPGDQAVLAWAAVVIDVGRGPAVAVLLADNALRLSPAGEGRHAFIGLAPSGQDDNAATMRSNASGIGTRLALRSGSRWILTDNWRRHSAPGQGLQPVVAGLGGARQLDFVSLTWSDGVFQTELDLAAGQLHRITETERQLSSCPVLFAWDGERYAFISDLLGVGGLGYFIEPGVTAPPRPRENFLLPAGLLKPREGTYVIKIGEPMEEVAYLDAVRLVAYDLPPGWDLVLDERMAITAPEATGATHYFQAEQLPVRAVTGDGTDVTERVTTADLDAAPVGELDRRFIGRLAGEQVLTLEFTPALDGAQPVLMIDGWVEYPYSQTMFAAWQAQADWRAPTLEARGSNGQWQVILKEFGYPAGMPRRMSVPLNGLPPGTTALRLRTNQEIYWDRVAVVQAEDLPQARRTTLPLASAHIAESGFARRSTGLQRQPHYDYTHRSPFWDTRHMAGHYTALGPMTELVAAVDDATAIIGPGEEVHLEFNAELPSLPAGWRRRFVVESNGWAKDMDLYTAQGNTLGPLPSSGLASGPRDALHARYNTRYRAGQ